MPPLTITPAQVQPGAGASFCTVLAAETIVPGQPCALNTNAQAVLATAAGVPSAATVRGVAINAAAPGQKVILQTGGDLILGTSAGLVIGMVYILGATAGTIQPVADLAPSWLVSVLGVGKAGQVLAMPWHGPHNSGVQVLEVRH